MTGPTPAAVNIAPSEASNIGNMDSGPTMSRRCLESSKNTFGVLSLEKTIRMIIATTTPTPTPTRALIFVKMAKMIAPTPIIKVGIKILYPILSDAALVYSFDAEVSVPCLLYTSDAADEEDSVDL